MTSLLTALAQTITTWVGHSSILIDLEGHGREDLSEGWISPKLSVHSPSSPSASISINGHTSPGSALKAVKEQLRCVPNRGLHGVLRYLTENPSPSTQSTPQPQVVFNYLGQVDSVVADLTCLHSPTNAGRHTLLVNRRHSDRNHWPSSRRLSEDNLAL